MKVLGIDPGSRTTGWGIVEKGPGGALKHVANGAISAGESLSLAERLFFISKGLEDVIRVHGPEAVSIESVFTHKNVRSAIMLGHARGVALLSAASNNLPVFEYAPMTIKLSVTGFGGAEKDQVKKMVSMLLKTPAPVKNDAADALAVAICHIHHIRGGTEKKAQPSAIPPPTKP